MNRLHTETATTGSAYEREHLTTGGLNVSVNCIARHLATRGDQTAIFWEGDNSDESTPAQTQLRAPQAKPHSRVYF